VLAWACSVAGCREPAPSAAPPDRASARPLPRLDVDDEALLASLVSDDPGDFHGPRARIWRAGVARWVAEGPELGGRPTTGARDFATPVEVVVVDEDGPRVLLPLAELGLAAPGLRVVARLAPSDLINGLVRERQPSAWLSLAAGVGLTPLERDGERLRVRWGDPDCGFGLELVVDAADFGPLYEPGPSGRPSDEPQLGEGATVRLAPGTQLYADAEGREPIVRLDANAPSEASRLRAAQRVRLLGKPSGKLQGIELRCRGVMIRGYAPSAEIVELPGRFAVVESSLPSSSSCAGFGGDRITVPAATPLYAPAPADGDPAPELIGVSVNELELPGRPIADGWWQACQPSPWGDLVFDFRPRG
jgi:hypothetical protein